MRSRLKGYTILEILMAMIISSIVLISAYSGMEKISFLYKNFRIKNEIINEVTLLNRILMHDISKSSYISEGNNSINCIYFDKKIEYIFNDNCVIRKSPLADTFNIPTSDMTLSFVKDGSGEATLFVNELNFVRTDKDEKYTLHYYKNYGADALINIKK
jgi:prepilin-type N-terminal cleavage/methylation domain-containing protein